MSFAAFAKLHLGADEEAVGYFRRSIELNRNYPLAHFGLAAALALLGRQEEAQVAARDGLALVPAFTVSRFCINVQSDNPIHSGRRERVMEGMRKAGIHE